MVLRIKKELITLDIHGFQGLFYLKLMLGKR